VTRKGKFERPNNEVYANEVFVAILARIAQSHATIPVLSAPIVAIWVIQRSDARNPLLKRMKQVAMAEIAVQTSRVMLIIMFQVLSLPVLLTGRMVAVLHRLPLKKLLLAVGIAVEAGKCFTF
jgi:hypothetical protein